MYYLQVGWEDVAYKALDNFSQFGEKNSVIIIIILATMFCFYHLCVLFKDAIINSVKEFNAQKTLDKKEMNERKDANIKALTKIGNSLEAQAETQNKSNDIQEKLVTELKVLAKNNERMLDIISQKQTFIEEQEEQIKELKTQLRNVR